MSGLFERLVAIFALLCASGFFAGAETALFSLSKVSREGLATKGDSNSQRLLRLLGNPRRLITTLIVGNELVNIATSSLAAQIVAGQLPWMRQAAQVAI